jgi:hypothetical protein
VAACRWKLVLRNLPPESERSKRGDAMTWTAAKLGETIVEWMDSDTCEGCPVKKECRAADISRGLVCVLFGHLLDRLNSNEEESCKL